MIPHFLPPVGFAVKDDVLRSLMSLITGSVADVSMVEAKLAWTLSDLLTREVILVR